MKSNFRKLLPGFLIIDIVLLILIGLIRIFGETHSVITYRSKTLK